MAVGELSAHAADIRAGRRRDTSDRRGERVECIGTSGVTSGWGVAQRQQFFRTEALNRHRMDDIFAVARQTLGAPAHGPRSPVARDQHSPVVSLAAGADPQPSVPGGTIRMLRTFGTPMLISEIDGSPIRVRPKDLALLIYLRIEASRAHSRSILAALLWGDHTERHARHSLTQALARLRAVLPAASLRFVGDSVAWTGTMACDFDGHATVPPGPEYPEQAGDFLAGLALKSGAESFEQWAEGRRALHRAWMVEQIDVRAAAAESRGDFNDALTLAARTTELEPYFERAHRRTMRCWARLGERTLALRHYRHFTRMLERETGLAPDPSTRALALEIERDAVSGGELPLSGPASVLSAV